MPTPDHSMYYPRAHLEDARWQRAEYLVALAQGTLSATDVILFACDAQGVALRTLGLQEVLAAQPKTSSAEADRILRLLAALLEIDVDLTTKSIDWLIDRRSGGRRLYAWLDATTARESPWPGYPWQPRPADPREPRAGA